jgi:hypothetical protein
VELESGENVVMGIGGLLSNVDLVQIPPVRASENVTALGRKL